MSFVRHNMNRIGFTLIELMVAVVVLLAVMIAVGRIFSTTSDISASGQAIAETIQQGVAIEQQLREDISKLSQEGFIGIRSVAVANNLKGDYLLIDDSLPPTAIIRCDQLVFFTDGFASPMLAGAGADFAGQGLATRMYYGHGVRFPHLDGHGQGDNNFDESDNPKMFESSIPTILTPWYEGVIEVETRKYTDSQDERFDVVADGNVTNGTQANPSEWTLCRQAVVLGDDDTADPWDTQKTVYMGSGISSHTVFPWDPRIGGNETYPHVLHGRVDIAATQLDDIRQSVLQDNTGTANRNWRDSDTEDQQELIASLFHWPRVEPVPPTSIRYDQALMFPALAEGCVSFQIEWTYDEGVGSAIDNYYTPYRGYEYADNEAQPWWGASYRLDPDDPANLGIGFDTLTAWSENAPLEDSPSFPSATIDPTLIEPTFQEGEGFAYAPVPTVMATGQYPEGVSEYWAIFGYNGTNPFYENGIDLLNDNSDTLGTITDSNPLILGNPTWKYTPIPSALRITIRILDRDNRLGSGWTYQFVVDLPEHNQ